MVLRYTRDKESNIQDIEDEDLVEIGSLSTL
jgi:hypothetical protein